MRLLLRIAARNLRQGGRRTWILGAAIALVTFLLVALGALASGLEATMIRSASTLFSGHVNIGGFYKVTRTQSGPMITEVAALRALARQEVPEATAIIDRMRGWSKVVGEQGSFFASLAGVDIAEEQGLLDVLQIASDAEGKPRGRIADLAEPDTAVLFESQAERLGAEVGEMLTLSTQTVGGQNNTADIRVVAIVRDVGFLSAWNLFLPKETVRRLYQLSDDASGVVQIYLPDPAEAAAVMERLRPKLEAAGHTVMDHDPKAFFMKFERVTGEDWVGQRLDLTTWRDEVQFMMWIITGFATIRALLLGTLMVLIVVGIMNAMWMSIRERTREVGTLRAIGMTRGQVRLMFLFEGVVLGFAAATLGAVIGGAVTFAVDAAAIHIPMKAFQMVLMSDTLHLLVAPDDVLGAVVTITTLTTLAALFPSWRASRLTPVTALQHRG